MACPARGSPILHDRDTVPRRPDRPADDEALAVGGVELPARDAAIFQVEQPLR